MDQRKGKKFNQNGSREGKMNDGKTKSNKLDEKDSKKFGKKASQGSQSVGEIADDGEWSVVSRVTKERPTKNVEEDLGIGRKQYSGGQRKEKQKGAGRGFHGEERSNRYTKENVPKDFNEKGYNAPAKGTPSNTSFENSRVPFAKKSEGNIENAGAKVLGFKNANVARPKVEPLMEKNFQMLEKKGSSLIMRGTAGRESKVETNYLIINIEKMPNIAYHYDVTITPDRPKSLLRTVFKMFNEKYFKDIIMAFDNNRNAYSIKKLPCKEIEQEVEIQTGTRSKTFVVQIKETLNFIIELDSLRNYSHTKVFEKPMRALQCLDVVLASPCFMRGLRFGRSFYTKPRRHYDLDNGFEMWTGLFQAAILGDQPFLNVDISNKSFYSQSSVLDFLSKNIDRFDYHSAMEKITRHKARFVMKHVEITYTPPPHFGFAPKIFRVSDISDEGSNHLKFIYEGEETTVEKYFARKGYRLLFPKLNCLQIGTEPSVYLPMELCTINNQICRKTDSPRQVRELIRWAATSTTERKEKIFDSLHLFNHNKDPIMRMFGISFETNFITVPMRILNPPKIIYARKKEVTPSDGSWRSTNDFLNTDGSKQFSMWAVIYFNKSLQLGVIRTFAKKFYDQAKQMNIYLNAPCCEKFIFSRNLMKDFQWLQEQGCGLVIVVIPRIGITYADIKQTAELECGMLTQCIKESNFTKDRNEQIIANILLKVNAKLNGINHKITNMGNLRLEGNVMFLGADVTHPSPEQRNIPSIVGVAASHDKDGFCYNIQIRFQEPTVEVIEDMESIILHHLRVYFKYHKSYPRHIFYFRDGVSDGQFPIVRKVEIQGVRKALSKLKVPMKLTCLIVVKRHHTRFFPIVKTKDKYNNVPPGSVVDRVIVHPNESEFFMVSHQSVQGTARPTRYNVIENDDNISIDDLQRLTFDLCHMFPRCTRSVSYPTPAYLAHLAAARGRVYIEGERSKTNVSKEPCVVSQLTNRTPMYFV